MKAWAVLILMIAINGSLASMAAVADIFDIPISTGDLDTNGAAARIPFQDSINTTNIDGASTTMIFGDWFKGLSMFSEVLNTVFNASTGNYRVWNALNIMYPFNWILTFSVGAPMWGAAIYLLTGKKLEGQ